MAYIKKSDVIEDDILAGAIKQAEELQKALEGVKSTLKETLDNSAKQGSKTPLGSPEDVAKITAAYKEFTTVKEQQKQVDEIANKLAKDRAKLESRRLEIQTDQFKQNEELKAQLNAEAKAIREDIKLKSQQVGTLEKLARRNKELNAARKTLNLETKAGRKELKSINDELNKNNEFIKSNVDNLSKQRMNVGNYTQSITDAIPQLRGFVDGIKRGASSLGIMAKASKTAGFTIKGALIATGIGILLPLLGSVVIFVTKFQVGMDHLDRAINAVSATISVLVERIGNFGKAIFGFLKGDISFKELQKQSSEVFEGMAQQIKDVVIATDALTKAKHALRDAEIDLMVLQKERERDAAKERRIATDSSKSIAERTAALRRLKVLEESIFEDRLKIAKENERIAEQDFFFSTQTADDERKRNEAIIARIDAETALENKRREINAIEKEINGVIRTQIEQAKRASTAQKMKLIDHQKEIQLVKELLDLYKRFNIVTDESTKQQKEIADATAKRAAQGEEFKKSELKRLKDESEAFKNQQEEIRRQIKVTIDAFAKATSARTNLLLDAVGREQAINQQNIDIQARLAERGLENNLAQEQEKQARLEVRRQRAAEAEVRRQKALAYFTQFTELSKTEPTSAAFKAAAQLAAAETIASLITGSFFDGTEDTGKANKPIDSNGGRLAMLHDNERVLTKEQNKAIGRISNDELVRLTSIGKAVTSLENKPQQVHENSVNIHWDSFGNVVSKTVKKGQVQIINHLKSVKLR